MASQSPRRWIVLIQKSPQGPFSEEAIRELMKKGMIRHNDLAYLHGEVTEGVKKPHDWKFLWQYPEFDRRKPQIDPATGKEIPLPPVPAEFVTKRKPLSEDEIRQRVAEALPAELLNIAPEDLIPHATGGLHLPDERQIAAREAAHREERRETPEPPASGGGGWGWLYPVGALTLMVFLSLRMNLLDKVKNSLKINLKGATSAPPASERPTAEAPPPPPAVAPPASSRDRAPANWMSGSGLPKRRPGIRMRVPHPAAVPPEVEPAPEPQSEPAAAAAEETPPQEGDAQAQNSPSGEGNQSLDGNANPPEEGNVNETGAGEGEGEASNANDPNGQNNPPPAADDH
jgi:hypothetical protein